MKGSNAIEGLLAYKPDDNSVKIELVENNEKNIGSGGEYKGVGGHLFAEAVKESCNLGYNGYVWFVSKTNLIEYYKKELGAELVVAKTGTMRIDESAAAKLYRRYYGAE